MMIQRVGIAIAVGAVLLTAAGGVAQERSSAQVFSGYETVRPGDRLPIAIELTVSEGWHTYAEEPGDLGMPPSFKFSGPEGVEVGPWRFPPAKEFVDPIGTSYGYEDRVVLLSEVFIPETVETGSVVELNVRMNWMICKDACVFQRGTQTLSIQTAAVSSGPSAAWETLLKGSRWATEVDANHPEDEK